MESFRFLVALAVFLAGDRFLVFAEFRVEDQPLDNVPEIPANAKDVVIRNTSLTAINALKLDGVKTLDLSSNSIGVFTQKSLQSPTQLQTLNLSSNVLTNYERYAFTVTSLQILDLSYNQLHELKKLSAKPLFELHTLHLDGNQIEEISDDFFEFLFKLEVFTARNNKLKTITLRLYYLTRIDVSYNCLENAVLANPRVTDLNLSSNNLDIANITGLAQCTNLVALDLSQNPIRNFSAIEFPSNLEELKLSKLDSIISSNTGELPPLPKLKILDLSYNNYSTRFLPQFQDLPVLNLIILDGNGLQTLNSTWPKSLTYIGLNDNDFSCAYLQEFIPKLRNDGIRLYFHQRTYDTDNVQGVRCKKSTEDVKDNVDSCLLYEENFVYAWHTTLSSSICFILAMIYIGILWKYRAKIRKIKNHEDTVELVKEEVERPYTYNNLLIKYSNDM